MVQSPPYHTRTNLQSSLYTVLRQNFPNLLTATVTFNDKLFSFGPEELFYWLIVFAVGIIFSTANIKWYSWIVACCGFLLHCG